MIRQCEARLRLRGQQFRRLLKAIDIEHDKIPKLIADELAGGPVEVARLLRATWKFLAGP